MLFSTIALTASLFAFGIQAQGSYSTGNDNTGGNTGSAASSASNAAPTFGVTQVQIVTVSNENGELKYFPEQVVADPGSIVQFQFYPKNHTVTQSSFALPCKPLAANLTSDTNPGQKSGFVPVTADTQFRPVYNLLVNDTKPIWIYCGQKGHCPSGMAMVINQNMSDPTKTLEQYKANAALLASSSSSSSAAGGSYGYTSSAAASVVTPPAGSTGLATSTSGGVATTSSASSAPSISTFAGGAAEFYAPSATKMGGFTGLVLFAMAAFL